MPVYPNGPAYIRANLERIAARRKVRIVPIGRLTDEQLDAINTRRLALGLGPIEQEIVFVGAHVYRSRIERDGYTLDDVVDQIAHAIEDAAVIVDSPYMTVIENPSLRADRYGNLVRDRAVLECSTRHPRPELYSVMPKGDVNKPPK